MQCSSARTAAHAKSPVAGSPAQAPGRCRGATPLGLSSELARPLRLRGRSATVKGVAHLPERKAVRPDDHGASHGPIVCQLRFPHHIQVPPASSQN